MVNKRDFWSSRIEKAWEGRSVIWLYGVRRAGKTTLCQTLPDIEYFDCELPSARRVLEDPESFLKSMSGKRVALDEIHRLDNPSQILKIAADHFPETRILATGSSTLQASTKFRDTLTGRKFSIWLTPLMSLDLQSFGQEDIGRRMHKGGLPPFFLGLTDQERDYEEWIDSFWAKDIQQLFHLERRAAFQKFLELILMQSGGVFEATAFATPCEISRTTVANYLSVLASTQVAHVIRPYSTHKATEIVAAPKVYGFDSGFVCEYRGWKTLRPEDYGILWEHIVLNEMHARRPTGKIRYWRDKGGHEVDFVIEHRSADLTAIECKWSVGSFRADHLEIFRKNYSRGENWCVAHDVKKTYERRFGNILVKCMNLNAFGDECEKI